MIEDHTIRLTSHKSDGLDSYSTEVAGHASLVLHAFSGIRGATVRACYRWFSRVDGVERTAVDFEGLGFIIVELVFVPGHLLTLLSDFHGLGSEVSISFTTHIRKLQQTSSKASSKDKVLVLESGTHG